MKGTAAILAGLALVGGGVAAQETTEPTGQEEYGTESSVISEDERADRTGTESTQSEYGQTQTTDPYGSDETETQSDETSVIPEAETTYGAEAGQDISELSAEELTGRTIVTSDGEEIGTVEQVGHSSMYQEQVVTVNVGGFLGVGEKTIAIPMSRLELGSDESLQTTMNRQEIEAAQEFDASDLESAEGHQQY